jgi:OOP family OmpA-OmpF porin
MGNNMKLLITAILSSLSLTVAAQGYVHSSDGQPVLDSSGQCVRTGSWTASEVHPVCNPKQVRNANVFLSADVLFGFDKSTLTAQGKVELDKLAYHVAHNSRITVTGHADWIGNAKYNQVLSERRARSVAEYLQTKVTATYTVMGIGSKDPLPVTESCRTEKNFKKLVACLAPNRRVDIDFQPR